MSVSSWWFTTPFSNSAVTQSLLCADEHDSHKNARRRTEFTSSHCKVVAQLVGLGFLENTVSEAAHCNQRWCYWNGQCFSALSPGHLPITFPELAFKCTYKTREDSKPNHLETIPGKLRTKSVCFQLHGLLNHHCQDKTAGFISQLGRCDSPFSIWGPFSSLCHPGIHLLRYLFHSEIQIGLTGKMKLTLMHNSSWAIQTISLQTGLFVCFILVQNKN